VQYGQVNIAMLSETSGQLRRVLGVGFALAVSIGVVILFGGNYSLCCMALIVLRRRQPELQRPYRAWGCPWSVWLVTVGSISFLVGTLAQWTRVCRQPSILVNE